MTSVGNTPSVPQHPSFFIEKSKAEKSYSKSGKTVKAGHYATRLQLGNDNRFSVAAKDKLWAKGSSKLFKKIYLNFRHVKLETENDPIYVNINSLAKRLHLSKEQIKEASKEGKLEALIEKQIVHQRKIVDEYERLFTSYDNNAELRQASHISKATLMKAVRVSVPILFDQTAPASSHAFKEEHLKEEYLFVATKKEGQLELTLKTETILGSGGFAVVSKGIKLNASNSQKVNQHLAFKLAKDFSDKPLSIKNRKAVRAQRDVRNEYEILHFLHEQAGNKPLRGIQAKPHAFVHLGTGDSGIVGYLGEKYDGDLRMSFKESTPVKLGQGLDILAGLAHVAKLGIVHGDIKPQNVLVREEEGRLVTHVSDFGNARKLNDTTGFLDAAGQKIFTMGAHTPNYVSERHKEAAIQAWKKGDYKQSNEILLRSDVFATGVLLYKFLSENENPCLYDKKGYVIGIHFNEFLLKQKKIPEDIINLLRDMLSVVPDETPSMQDAFDRFQSAMDDFTP